MALKSCCRRSHEFQLCRQLIWCTRCSDRECTVRDKQDKNSQRKKKQLLMLDCRRHCCSESDRQTCLPFSVLREWVDVSCERNTPCTLFYLHSHRTILLHGHTGLRPRFTHNTTKDNQSINHHRDINSEMTDFVRYYVLCCLRQRGRWKSRTGKWRITT